MTRFTLRDRGRPGYTYLDVLALLVLVPFLILSFACWNSGRSRPVANRVKCASNLRQIGQAILLYSNENGGAYPRTRFVGGETVTPVFGTGITATNPFADDGPAPNDVTAALFLLLRTQDITSEVFTCPSSNAERDSYGGGTNSALNRCNFSDLTKNLSYSYQNPYPDDAAIERGFKLDVNLPAEFAVAADINPGTKGSDDNVLAVTTTSSATLMKKGNSKNHDGDGQNVLYGDGHVEFQQNPFVGVNRDHIYARAGERKTPVNPNALDGVVRSPRDKDDSVLLPTDD